MDEILNGDPRRLARLLDERSNCGGWDSDDLRAMLQHQLAAPVLPDLGPAALACGLSERVLSTMRFGELLSFPDSPGKLFLLAKEFAKSCDTRADRPLPTELAAVLYCSVI